MDSKGNILLLANDASFGNLLQEVLTGKGYQIDYCSDNDQAASLCSRNTYGLYIADDAKFVREARMSGDRSIILLLGEKNNADAIVAGYQAGCDEYIAMPCPTTVLECKIESWLRRNTIVADFYPEILHIGEYDFNSRTQILTHGGEEVHLSSKESATIYLLALNMGRVVERSYILRKVWAVDNRFTDRSLSVYINHLRNKFSDDKRIRIISIHGKGYKMIVEDGKNSEQSNQ